MFPSLEQIAVAAYHRWERRGHAHGRDADDWCAAEQDLLFALNYEVVAHFDGATPASVGDPDRRVCRFCEQGTSQVAFADAPPALPDGLQMPQLVAFDQCGECREHFQQAIDLELDLALDRVRSGAPGLSLAGFKGLTRAALAILPTADLESFGDAIEWVSNPDHDLDAGAFNGLGGFVHRSEGSGRWAAIARRSDAGAPMPRFLAFFGLGDHVLAFALPLNVLDDERDGEASIVPRVASPFGTDRQPPESTWTYLPAATGRPATLRPAESTRPG